MINIPNEPLLFDLFYGGKGAGEESEEDLLNRMKTAIPRLQKKLPHSATSTFQILCAEVREGLCSSTDYPKCRSAMSLLRMS